ncbi:MAG: hypothetical protein EBS51_10645 [Planctomycetia bacterium]|jgi:hypothetical protein|nr:hypothetical protein [Planctomycetia bacterium]
MIGFVRAIALTLVVGLVPACAPSLPAGKVRVKGVVKRGGAPLGIVPPATGSLNFAGTAGGDSGTAPIGQDGGFTVVLSPGTYAVSVLAKDGVDTMDEQGTPVLAKNLVAEKFGSTETSGLEVTVDADGKPLVVAVD